MMNSKGKGLGECGIGARRATARAAKAARLQAEGKEEMVSGGVAVVRRCQRQKISREIRSREEELRGGPVLHSQVFDMCWSKKEGDLERVTDMAVLLGG